MRGSRSVALQAVWGSAGVAPEQSSDSQLYSLPKFPFAAIQYCFAIVDAVLILFASVAGGIGYQLAANSALGNTDAFIGTGVLAALLYVLIGQSVGFYQISTIASAGGDTRKVFALWSIVGLLLTLLAFLLKISADFSRGSIICFSSLALVVLAVSRFAAKGLVKSAAGEGKIRGRRTILLGSRDELASLEGLDLLQNFGVTEVGRVNFANTPSNPIAFTRGETELLDDVLSIARASDAHEIALALPWSDTRKLQLVRDYLRSSPLPLRLLPDRHIRGLMQNPMYRLEKTLSVEIQRAPLIELERAVKRIIDVVGAMTALLALSPIMAIASIAIKLDSRGPILFRQRRTGFNSKQFSIFKFRTMTVMEDGPNVVQARKSDLRVTRIGKILRQTSIDELPQLLNVLRGDMSLIGPRPHAVAHDGYYGDLLSAYAFRHHVKPGISGWAQVNGYRGEIHRVEQMKARIDHDLWYIKNWSVMLDLKIILLTCLEVMRRRNAY